MKKLRIAFDARYTRLERHDGISRFTASLAESLSRYAEVTLLIHDPRQLKMLPPLASVKICSPTSWKEPWALRSIRDLEVDVVFSPMQTIGTFGRRHPLVLTIHDLIYYSHPQPPANLPAPVRFLWRVYHLSYAPQRWLLSRCEIVAAVSGTTAQLIKKNALTKAPVRVVSNAPTNLPEASEHPVLPQPAPGGDFLYMGSFMPYKGVEKIIEAAGRVPGSRIHIASRADQHTLHRLRSLAQSCGADVIFHQGADDVRYRELLEFSTALITASQAEGFGLPLVEALSVGTPVLVSDLPIFHEVAADRGIFFDPEDLESIAQGMRKMLRERPRYISGAKEQSERFSWDRSAQALLGACQEAIERYRSARTGR